MDVIAASLTPHHPGLCELADAVDASWWRFPPWGQSHYARPTCAQERLWLAALEVLRSTDCTRPRELADRIAGAARVGNRNNSDENDVESWRRAAHRILRAEAAIQHAEWQRQPVGLAIQLVLSRPNPTAFKTWFDDAQLALPPAVAWSAAALCGLLHGYRGLDTRFRGKPAQREVVALKALQLCSDGTRVVWPGVSNDPPKWRKQAGDFILSWGGREFACKHEQERGLWYAADLGIDDIHCQALTVAKEKDWQCVSRVLTLEGGTRSTLGPGRIEYGDEGTLNVLERVQIRLSPGDQIDETIDPDAFRHLVAVQPGRMPALRQPQDRTNSQDYGIPGLKIVPNFLTDADEKEILARIDQSDWSRELQRHVQHYGWRYDYKSRQIDPSMRIGPLPDWANRMAHRLFDEGLVAAVPDQLIVNEYCGNQGIARHIDSPSSFADGVAMISLLETWEMDFRKRGGHDKATARLDQRSAAILTGEARYEWTHEIRKRKNEPGPVKPGNTRPSRIPRCRRVSLTFRKVIDTARDRRAQGR